MHILIPVFFHAPLGGLQDNVFSTALYCKKNMHEVTVICKEGPFEEKLKQHGFRVITTEFQITEYNRVIRDVIQLHQERPIDIIHSHPIKSRSLALKLSKVLKKPLFLTIHGRYTDDLDTYINDIAMVFPVSEGIKNYILDNTSIQDKHKFYVMPNGVNRHLFQPSREARQDQRDTITAALVSRLDTDKRFIIEIFYKALAFTVAKYGNKVRWKIVGEGSLKEDMIQRVKQIAGDEDTVHFAGWKEGSDLYHEYAESDILLAPGRCALEGLSCGKPVIALGSKGYVGLIDKSNWLKGVYSNFGGIGNRMDDYVDGEVERDLAALLDDQAYREELGEMGVSIINEFYNEEHINEKLVNLYTMFLQPKDASTIDWTTLDRMIEVKIEEVKTEQVADNEWNITILCSDYDDLQFAWYIKVGRGTVDKIMYSSNNTLRYTFDFERAKSYNMICFIRNTKTKEKFSFLCAEITAAS